MQTNDDFKIPYLGLDKALGVQNVKTYEMEVVILQNEYDGGQTVVAGQGTLRATFDPDVGQFTTERIGFNTSRTGVNDGVDTLLAGYTGSPNSLCPDATEFRSDGAFGGYYTVQCDLTSVTNTDSGIFEYVVVLSAIAGISVIIAILMRGIWLTKKAIRTVTEETNEADLIEYYEDDRGRERWRIKRRHYYQ